MIRIGNIFLSSSGKNEGVRIKMSEVNPQYRIMFRLK